MGLDMYLYRATKVSEDEAKTWGKADNRPDDVALFDNVTENGVRDLADIATKVTLEVMAMDEEKWEKDFPYDCGGCGTGGDGITFFFHKKKDYPYEEKGYGKVPEEIANQNEDKTFDFLVTPEEYQSYFYPKMEDLYAVRFKEVAYWRKHYGLEDAMYDAYDGDIENCGWHKLNDAMADLVREYVPENDGSYFYHEWY